MGVVGLGLVLLVLPVFLSGSPEQRRTPIVIPEGSFGVVAYGSLMSLKSLGSTLGRKYEGPAHRVHLTGYERAWSALRPNDDSGAPGKIRGWLLRGGERVPFAGTVSMNIRPHAGGRMNAVLYIITGEDLIKLDKRERGYKRADVTDQVEEFDAGAGRIFAYEALPTRADGGPIDPGTYILIREFHALVTGACDLLGKDFRDEFDRTTRPCEYPIVPFSDIRWEMAE